MAKPVRPEMAEASRRAAAMFRHWRRDDTDGVEAVLEELDHDDHWAWFNLALGLLNVGTEMAKAAVDGQADNYLDHTAGAAALDEVMGNTDG